MRHLSFEETYPHYEFSELVRLGIAAAVLARRYLDRKSVDSADDPVVVTSGVSKPESLASTILDH